MKDNIYKEYLSETKLLDFSNKNIQKLILDNKWNELSDVEKVKSSYNFTKEKILFGYNKDDCLKASEVLKDGFGQCNTKSILLMALLRALKIPCRIHGFTIDKKLQKGSMTGLVYKLAPKEIFHTYVEVYVNNRWYDLEGVILDDKYLNSLQKIIKPNTDGSFVGYGVATKNFLNPTIYFECCNTYIQNEGIIKDYGIFDNPDELFKEYGQKMNFLKKLSYKYIGRKVMNKNVKKLEIKFKFNLTYIKIIKVIL